MSDTNPQIEAQLEKLSELGCQILSGDTAAEADTSEVTDKLLKSLLMSGYARKKKGSSLQSEIETRVKEKCREPAMHRGGALSSLTEKWQNRFNDLEREQSRQPEGATKPKAANISSATDS